VRSTEFAVITGPVDGPQLVRTHDVATLDGDYLSETALVDGEETTPRDLARRFLSCLGSDPSLHHGPIIA
jgi:hypothetical protein